MSSRLARRVLRPMIPALASVLAVSVSVATVAAASPSPAASSSAQDPIRMVVIGDSIPFTAFCGECTAGFSDLFTPISR